MLERCAGGLWDSGLFDFWLRFDSVTGFFKPAPSPRPRQKIKNPRCPPLHHFCQCSSVCAATRCGGWMRSMAGFPD